MKDETSSPSRSFKGRGAFHFCAQRAHRCHLTVFASESANPLNKHITVEYHDLRGERQVVEAGPDNDLAELLQHELDHLDGVLCIDRVKDMEDVVAREVFEDRYRSNSPYAQNAR